MRTVAPPPAPPLAATGVTMVVVVLVLVELLLPGAPTVTGVPWLLPLVPPWFPLDASDGNVLVESCASERPIFR